MIKVGLDLDGVIYNFIDPFIEFLQNKEIKPDKSKYSLGINKQDLSKHLTEFGKTGPFRWIPVYKDNLKAIKKKNIELYVITNRDWYTGAISDTIQRLYKDKIKYKKILFTVDKGYTAKELGLDYFYEDNVEFAKKILKKSAAYVLLLNREYNQNFQHEKLIRINQIK